MEAQKRTLELGCHKGTVISRDIAPPEVYDSRDAAIAAFNKRKEVWADFGYSVWFASLTAPDGKKEWLQPYTF